MKRVFLCLLVIMLIFGSANVWAHSVTIDDPYDMELGDSIDIGHNDKEDWKGILTLTVKNTGDAGWGDFHFYLLTPDVYFSDTLSSLSGVSSYNTSLSDDQQTLNFYFYDDPVITNESVTFQIYTDNTASKNLFFGMIMEASPVPIPGTLVLLGSGLFAMMRFRKNHRKV